eukprot:TRINITY_DN961_c0_g1_i1.p1 TRINITY_DN961_c0_g1~~TRINITY_DN961_c0_g1_i1.p1  ORF type:complete len:707 (-),score=206.59 TRINITY_DN961_c0_g1_i1:292-2412(-)
MDAVTDYPALSRKESTSSVMSSSSSESDASDSEVEDIFNMSEVEIARIVLEHEREDATKIKLNERGFPVEGSPRALIRHLLSQQSTDYQDAVLLTFPAFADPALILKVFIQSYRAASVGVMPGDSKESNNDALLLSSTEESEDGTRSRRSKGDLSPKGAGSKNTSRKSLFSASEDMRSQRAHDEGIRIIFQFRIIKMIMRLIELRAETISASSVCRALFNRFVDMLSYGDVKERGWANQLTNNIKEAAAARALTERQLSTLKHSPSGEHLVTRRKQFEFTDVGVDDLAEQLTILDQKAFLAIKLDEYLNQSWTKPDADMRAPHITAAIEQFNQNTFWVASTIIIAPGKDVGIKQRAEIIIKFIQLLEKFKKLNNYSGMQVICSALSMNCVTKLSKAWSQVPAEWLQKYQELSKLVSQEHNYRDYREFNSRSLLSDEPQPCVPLLEVLLRDMFFIDENPTIDEDSGLVSFDKMTIIGKIFKQVHLTKKLHYAIKEDVIVKDYINSRLILSENELNEKASIVENLDESNKEALKNAEERLKEDAKQKATKKEKEKKTLTIRAKSPLKLERKKSSSTKQKTPSGNAVKGVLSPQKREMEEVLIDRKLCEAFETYLKAKMDSEYLRFFLAVETYRRTNFASVDELKQTAREIYNRFLKDGSEEQISVGTEPRMLEPKLQNPTVDIYDKALIEVRMNLTTSFTSFMVTYEG